MKRNFFAIAMALAIAGSPAGAADYDAVGVWAEGVDVLCLLDAEADHERLGGQPAHPGEKLDGPLLYVGTRPGNPGHGHAIREVS